MSELSEYIGPLSQFDVHTQRDFIADLNEIISRQIEKSVFYHDLCDRVGYKPDQIKSEEDILDIPFVSDDDFKMSGGNIESLLCVPKDELEYYCQSSATSGDPSLVGRTLSDIDVVGKMYRYAAEIPLHIKEPQHSMVFMPNWRWIDSVSRGEHEGLPTRLFGMVVYESVDKVPEESHYLLKLNKGKTIVKSIMHRKKTPDFSVDWKEFEEVLERVQAGETAIIGGPVILTYNPLIGHYKPGTFDVGDNMEFLMGSGGWEGKKGAHKTNTGKRINKAEFVSAMSEMFGVPPEKFSDNYGTTETPVSFPGRWIPELEDFEFEVPYSLRTGDQYARVVLRDAKTLQPIKKTGVKGLIQIITPYGVEGYAGASLLVRDLVKATEIDGPFVQKFMIVGRYVPETTQDGQRRKADCGMTIPEIVLPKEKMKKGGTGG